VRLCGQSREHVVFSAPTARFRVRQFRPGPLARFFEARGGDQWDCLARFSGSFDWDYSPAFFVSTSLARFLKSSAIRMSSNRLGLFSERPSANREHNSDCCRRYFASMVHPHFRNGQLNGEVATMEITKSVKKDPRVIRIVPVAHMTVISWMEG